MRPDERAGTRSRLTRAVAALLFVSAGLVAVPSRPALSAPAVEPGSALAASSVLSTAIVYGGFTAKLSVAESRAYYQASAAEASAHGIATGALGSAGTGGSTDCSTGAGAPNPLGMPPFAPVTADSTNGPQHKTSGPIPIGVGEVSAASSPQSASATTSALKLGIPGILEISGQSSARVAFEDGKKRSAGAGVSIDVTLAGGLVKLSGLTWDAANTSGDQASSRSRFTLAGVRVGLATLPVETPAQIAGAITKANKALAGVGLVLDWPHGTDTKTNSAMSGLTLHITQSPLAKLLLKPVMTLKVAVQQLLAKLTSGFTACPLAQLVNLVGGAELVADVILGSLAGEGEIALTIGGVSAGTEPPPAYRNPFEDAGPNALPPPPAAPSVVAPPTGDVTDDAAAPAPEPAAPLASPVAVAAPAPVAQPAALAPAAAYRLNCSSTNTEASGGCSSGASAAALAGLLAAAIALFAADVYQSRRRRPIVRRRIV